MTNLDILPVLNEKTVCDRVYLALRFEEGHLEYYPVSNPTAMLRLTKDYLAPKRIKLRIGGLIFQHTFRSCIPNGKYHDYVYYFDVADIVMV